MNIYNSFKELAAGQGGGGSPSDFNYAKGVTIENMGNVPGLLFSGSPVSTHSSEQGHGGKLEPEHVDTRHQKYGEIKVWHLGNGKFQVARKGSKVPEAVAEAFVRFCEDNAEKIQEHLAKEQVRLADSTQVSFKKAGEHYDGKTIPKSGQESSRKQRKGRTYQQPDSE